MCWLRDLLVSLTIFLAASNAFAQNPQDVPTSEAVDRLIAILENAALQDELLTYLRSVSPEPGSDSLEVKKNAPGTSEDLAQTSSDSGLIGALGKWTNDFLTELPIATFGMPIEAKAHQAWVEIASRGSAGIENGDLLEFASWASPAIIVIAVIGYLLRKLAARWVVPVRPVRKGRLVAGLALKTLAHVGLFLTVGTLLSISISRGHGSHTFLTVSAGLLVAFLASDVLISALSGLTEMRGRRLVRYCQVKFYPWLLTISGLAIGAALCLDPQLRHVIGRSAADLVAFMLNLCAAATTLVFVFRHRTAIGGLIFGSLYGRATSSNPVVNATRQLATHWHLFGYAFLSLSIASLVAGQRDNDVMSQILWCFGTVLGALVLATLFRRQLSLRSRRIRRSIVKQALLTALYDAFYWISDVAIAFGTILVLGRIWNIDLWDWLLHDGRQLSSSLFAAAVCVTLAWILWVAIDAWIASALTPVDPHGRPMQSSNRARTLLPLVRNGILILLAALTIIAVLANIGVDVTPLIAGAGVFGLALSFGSQQLVQDVITGLFILAEDTIAIGDRIDTGDRSGVVESISLRTIRLRDADGALHSVPFSTVKAFKNGSRSYGVFRPRYAVPSGVDPNTVLRTMRETVANIRSDSRHALVLKGDLVDCGIDEIRAGAVVVTGSVRTLPMRQTDVARVFNSRFIDALAKQGISL